MVWSSAIGDAGQVGRPSVAAHGNPAPTSPVEKQNAGSKRSLDGIPALRNPQQKLLLGLELGCWSTVHAFDLVISSKSYKPDGMLSARASGK